jgi:hypothetical protein
MHPRWALYLHQIRIAKFILQFDVPAGRGLSVWRWYVLSFKSLPASALTENHRDRPVNDAGERVTPSDLAAHRLSHRFLGPCCLCAVSDQPTFTESAIVMVLSGHRAGQYVARCAQALCGYYGA